MIAVSLMVMLSACAASPPVPETALPPKPAWLNPVAVPQPQAGMDGFLLLANTRSQLDLANTRLRHGGTWVDCVQQAHASKDDSAMRNCAKKALKK